MDNQMERLVSLGILSKNSTSHTSPVMLITRKLTKDKRPVVDFRLLNIQELKPLTKYLHQKHINNVSFCGVVNYLSLFCPDLQTLLKLIVELTRKGRPFIWGDP